MTDSNAAILAAGNAHPLDAAGRPVPRDKHYPAIRYSDTSRDKKTGELIGVRVLSQDEDDALGDGWHDSPKKVNKVPKAKPEPKAAKAPKAPKAKPAAKEAAPAADTKAEK